MKYVIENFANGVSIGKVETEDKFDYNKSDKIAYEYIEREMPNRKEIASSMSSGDSYSIFFDEEKHFTLCIYTKCRVYMDVKDSEGNPIVLGQVYEGHEKGSDTRFRYSINPDSWNKGGFYIRNLSRCSTHYDWSSGSPKEIPAISDKCFSVNDGTQSFIDEYELKPETK